MAPFRLLPLKNTKDVEKITQLNSISVYNLVKSGRLVAEKVNGKLYFCNNSLTEFTNSFNINDYFKINEVSEELKKNNIYDDFITISKTKNKTKIKKRGCSIVYKYIRYLDEFPISPKQLVTNDLIIVDKDISPTLYNKASVSNAITILKQKSLIEAKVKKDIAIQKEIDFEKEKLLKSRVDKWEVDLLKNKFNNLPFNTPEPTLSTEDINKIIEDVNNKHIEIDPNKQYSLDEKNSRKNFKKPNNFKNIRRIGKQ